jgi:hypothetical protein
MEADMRRLGWLALAALAGIAGGCADDNALYTSWKYVPGYTPPGSSSSTDLAYNRQQSRYHNADQMQAARP